MSSYETYDELIMKATRMKPIHQEYKHDYIPPLCPACGYSLLDYGQHYCDDCGQKLDWTEPLEGQGELEL